MEKEIRYAGVHYIISSFSLTGHLGDVVYLENFGVPLVVLNSYEAATELLEKRSIKYSSRQLGTMIDELSVNRPKRV